MLDLLIITNEQDVSIKYLISKFENAGISYFRLNSEDINRFEFQIDLSGEILCRDEKNDHRLNEVKSVLFRRIPSRYAKGNEGEDHSYLNLERKHFLEGLYLSLDEAKWINPMFATQIAERKLYQLKVAKEIGIAVPKSLFTSCYDVAYRFLQLNPDAIIKPISNGLQVTSNKTYSIYTSKITPEVLESLNLSQTFDTPIFLQEQIPNAGDIRVTIIGNDLFAVKILKDSEDVDWRKPSIKKSYQIIQLPSHVKKSLLGIHTRFNLIYSAIDLIVTPDSRYVFLEINPVGEWAWLEIELGLNISDKIINQLK
jgi:glutathione synthase/RimK-type ligase-like ATP-grasp enzyme